MKKKGTVFLIRDSKLKTLLKKGGRMGAREDFIELLKRAVFPDKKN